MNDNIMIVLTTNREGIGHPSLKWHRVVVNTLLESKTTSSHKTIRLC